MLGGGDGWAALQPPTKTNIAWKARNLFSDFSWENRSIFHLILIVLLEFFVNLVLKLTNFHNLYSGHIAPSKAAFGGLDFFSGALALGWGRRWVPPPPNHATVFNPTLEAN